MKILRIIAFLPILTTLWACGSDEEPAFVEAPKPEFNAVESRACPALKTFDVDFFQAYSASCPGRNVVSSPMSAAIALSMLAEATDNATCEQICKALGCDDVDVLRSLSSKYMKWLPAADASVQLKMANSVWYKNEFTLRSDKNDVLQSMYKADVYGRDFSAHRRLVDEINSWCSAKTQGLIPKIIDDYDGNAVAFLANALYFKGNWKEPFNESKTDKAFFHGPKADERVDMMHDTDYRPYMWDETWQKVMLPFSNGTFVATLILPDEGVDIDDFIASEDFKNAMTSSCREYLVNLSVPRFKLAPNTEEITYVLKTLGITNIDQIGECTLFKESPQSLTHVYQRGSIEFNEKGVEAAAVTINGMVTSPGPSSPEESVTLTFDRPFIVNISETVTGRNIFTAKVVKINE